MAKADIQPYQNAGSAKVDGSVKAYVASGTTGSILSGEPVSKAAGVAGVASMATGGPVAANRIYGIATTQSTETASAFGTVDVIPVNPNQTWQCAPLSQAAIATQTLYNALIGKRVLFDKTAGVYTVATATADSTNNGLIIEYNDLSRFPGVVVFSFSPQFDYRNV